MLIPDKINMSHRPPHAHYFERISSTNMGHRHTVSFFTYPVNGNGEDGHIHDYQGHTSFNQGHFHRVIGFTGPAVPLPDGSHYHRLYGEVNNEPFQFQGGSYKTVLTLQRHTHSYWGATGKGIGYER